MNWDYRNPFTWRVSVESSAIDVLGHVNNIFAHPVVNKPMAANRMKI